MASIHAGGAVAGRRRALWTGLQAGQLHLERHATQRMGGAAQAGVVGARCAHRDSIDVVAAGPRVTQGIAAVERPLCSRATARTASFMAWLLCVVLTIRLHCVTGRRRRSS
jgi:hypothetical protein